MRRYGKGLVAYCPYVFHHSFSLWKKDEQPRGQRSFLIDLCRGMLVDMGKPEIARRYVVPSADRYGFLRAPVENGRPWLYIGLGMEPLSLPLGAPDLWRGRQEPVLGHDVLDRDQGVALIPRR